MKPGLSRGVDDAGHGGAIGEVVGDGKFSRMKPANGLTLQLKIATWFPVGPPEHSILNDAQVNILISDIYDCAAVPELWPQTMEKINSAFDGAYSAVMFADYSRIKVLKMFCNNWDMSWFGKLEEIYAEIPDFERSYSKGIDAVWSQMEHVSEVEFQKSRFYRDWVAPQGLRDALISVYLDRTQIRGTLTVASYKSRDLFSDAEKRAASLLTPHIRRAVSINDIVDKGNMALALYRQVLDNLSVAVFVVGAGAQLKFTNAKGDALLSDGDVLRTDRGTLHASINNGVAAALNAAIERATRGDRDLGISGIGVPLKGLSGARAAAYVLPLDGKSVRGDLASGCAAIFIAGREEQQPMVVEILRTLYDLTPTEAKVAYASSLGESTEAIAATQGVTRDTVRSHLKKIYVKTDVPGKTALAARIHAIVPPLSAK